MGQGGRIVIVNKTGYTLIPGVASSTRLCDWYGAGKPHAAIPPDQQQVTYAEFNEHWDVNVSKDAGEATWNLGATGATLHVRIDDKGTDPRDPDDSFFQCYAWWELKPPFDIERPPFLIHCTADLRWTPLNRGAKEIGWNHDGYMFVQVADIEHMLGLMPAEPKLDPADKIFLDILAGKPSDSVTALQNFLFKNGCRWPVLQKTL